VLRLDRSQDGLFALVEQAELSDTFANAANLLFIQAAGLIATVPRNERHRITVVQEGDSTGDLVLFDAELARQAAEVNRNRRCHEEAEGD
jgi:hypothetical protein